MTDDRFLHDHRREPRPGFARALRERLRRTDPDEAPARAARWMPALAAAASIALVTLAFTLPAVRASAQALLDLFRVRNFAAVPFDPERLEKLEAVEHDGAMLVFDRKQILQEPGAPELFPTPGAATAKAGFTVAEPSYLPGGLALDTVSVSGEARAVLAVSSARLRSVLDALGLHDVTVPAGLDGRDITVHTYPLVTQRYRADKSRLELMQSRSPEVGLPAGVDLARLGEVGLRILGLDAGEARRMAGAIDWRSTLVVPVPVNAAEFRQITVRGNPGLLVTVNKPSPDARQARRTGSLVMWSEGDRVFALNGTMYGSELVQIAESVR
jgi:hypothetical protein